MSNIYYFEVMNGFNLSNHNENELEYFASILNNFYKTISCRSFLIKLNTTFRTEDNIEFLKKKINLKGKANSKENLVVSSVLNSLENYKKTKIPTIYFKFISNDKNLLMNEISAISSLLKLREVSIEEFNAIKMSTFSRGEKVLEKSSNFKVGEDKYVAGFADFVNHNLPNFWLRELFYDDRISFSLEINPQTLKEKNKTIKSIKKWSSKVDANKSILMQAKEEQNEESRLDMLMDFLVGSEAIMNMNLYFIYKVDKSSQFSASRQVHQKSMKLFASPYSSFKLKIAYNRQIEYLNYFWGNNKNYKSYPVTTYTLGNSFIFENTTTLPENGLYLGTSSHLYPFSFDRYDKNRSVHHYAIFGQSGSGKSALVKLLSCEDITLNKKQYIFLDPHNEYGTLAKSFGGQIINLEEENLNPLKVISFKNFDEKEANKLAGFFKEFLISSMMDELNFASESIKDVTQISNLLKAFLLKNISQIHKGKEFIIGDFYASLSVGDKKSYKYIFDRFIKGTLNIFNKKETLNFDNKIIDIVLPFEKDIEKSYKNGLYKVIFKRLMDYVYSYENKGVVLHIDEAGDFFKDEYLLTMVAPLFKDIRKFGSVIGFSTQQITDLVNPENINPMMASIFANTPIKFIGTLDMTQISTLNKLFVSSNQRPLEQMEIDHIEEDISQRAKVGNFLLLEGHKRLSLEIKLNELPLIAEMFMSKDEFNKYLLRNNFKDVEAVK